MGAAVDMGDQRNAAPPRRHILAEAKRQHRGVDGPRPPRHRVKDQRWPGTVMAVGLFVSLFTLLWLGRRTFIEPLTLLRWMAGLCIAGTLLPYGWSGLRLGMEKLEWFFFNVLAIGPLSISALLAVNHYVHGPVRWTEAPFGADLVISTEEGGVITEHRLSGRNDLYFSEEEQEASRSKRFRVGVARGCLGYWSITDVEVLP